MTNNEYTKIVITDIYPHYHKIYSIFDFIAPCYYQYTAQGQNFDKLTGKLNFSIVFHNERFIHRIRTAHCRWLSGSAFNSTKPTDINKKIIISNLLLAYQKLICYCSCNNTQYCYVDTLGTVYPGQTISLSLALNEHGYIHDYTDTAHNEMIIVEINDDVLPPTACKLAQVSELIHKVSTYCTVINFTIVHNGLNYLHWCELFIKTVSTHQTEAYYFDILPCPPGFAQQNGICICDPILTLILSITTCDINHQTIL